MDVTALIIMSLFAIATFVGIVGGYLYATKDESWMSDVIMWTIVGPIIACAAMGISILLFTYVPLILFGVLAALAVVYKISQNKKIAEEAKQAEAEARYQEIRKRFGR